MKKGLLLLLLTALLTGLTGCIGYQLENRVLAVCMALDLTEDEENRIMLSIQISNAAGEAGGENEKGYSIISAKGKDWFDVLGMMRGVSTHILNFTQLRAIIVSEELSRDELFFQLLKDIYQMPQMRSNAHVLVAMGGGIDFLRSSKPDIGVSLSKYVDIVISNTINKGLAPHSTIGELVRDMGEAPMVMLGAVAGEKSTQALPARNPHDLLPNGLTSEASGAIRLIGAAATDGKAVVGLLTGYEVQLLTLLWGHTEEILCHTENGSVIVKSKQKTRLAIRFGSPDVLVVKVFLYGFVSPEKLIYADEAAAVIERDLRQLIEKLQSLQIDAAHFKRIAIKGFDTIERFERYNWLNHYINADIEIEAEVVPMASII